MLFRSPQPAAVPAPAADATAELKALFPALFTGKPKPVKLRIQADIQERAPGRFSKAQLSAFLRRHTGGTGYLIALTQAKTRFDLDGQPAGDISEEHLAVAREELARRRGLKQEREQMEVQQRRNRAQLLWDFERTTLTEANLCALKGVAVAELPGLLEIARKERAEAPVAPPREARREDRRPDRREARRDGGRPEGRGPRHAEPRADGRHQPPRGERRDGGRKGGPQQPGRDAAAPVTPQSAPAAAPSADVAPVEPPKDQAAE